MWATGALPCKLRNYEGRKCSLSDPQYMSNVEDFVVFIILSGFLPAHLFSSFLRFFQSKLKMIRVVGGKGSRTLLKMSREILKRVKNIPQSLT